MINRRSLRTRNVKMLILDEADEMLSRGFKEQIYDIYRFLPPNVQVWFLSKFLHISKGWLEGEGWWWWLLLNNNNTGRVDFGDNAPWNARNDIKIHDGPSSRACKARWVDVGRNQTILCCCGEGRLEIWDTLWFVWDSDNHSSSHLLQHKEEGFLLCTWCYLLSLWILTDLVFILFFQ